MKGGGNKRVSYSRDLSKTHDDYSDSGSSNRGGLFDDDDCETINYITSLDNLQPASASYGIADIMKLELDSAGLVVASGIHGVCGTVKGIMVMKIKKCMEDGKSFKATVTQKTATSCEVRIRLLKP